MLVFAKVNWTTCFDGVAMKLVAFGLCAWMLTIGPIRGELDTSWDGIQQMCPSQCVCQRSHLLDMSIARWTRTQYEAQPKHRNNEVTYEEETVVDDNPFLKLAMCMLQDNGNGNDVSNVLVALPPDVQALVLLYNNGADKNISLYTSDLLSLVDLTVLEVRAANAGALRVHFDDPLPNLRYANFETIELVGTRSQAPNPVHPSDLYDYVPESERLDYNVSHAVDEDVEIVPYEVYVEAEKRAKMASFSGYTALRLLRVHKCRLDELHWEMFDGLRHLEHLSLEHNEIKIIPPFAFYGAMYIRSLSLAHNSILDLNYRALTGLLRLEWLDLSHNQLTHVSELTFPPFPKMKTIDFRHNPIHNIFPMSFGIMNATKNVFLGSDVEALDLSKEHLFRSLGLLTTLRIENGSAESLHQNIFRGLRSVEQLTIHGRIRQIEFDAFADMPVLRELILSDCQLEELSMDVFYGALQLEVVDMSSNRLRFLAPKMFDGLTRIREIYLQNNKLASLPDDMFSVGSLKLLRLTGNPWQCRCFMSSWKQHITNAVRAGRSNQHCVHDASQPNGVRCSSNANAYQYEYDGKMTPRCDGGPESALGRSVYYTLRRTLRCPLPAAKVRAKMVAQANKPRLTEKQQRQLKKHQKMMMTQNELRFQLLPKRGSVNNRKKLVEREDNEMENRLDGAILT